RPTLTGAWEIQDELEADRDGDRRRGTARDVVRRKGRRHSAACLQGGPLGCRLLQLDWVLRRRERRLWLGQFELGRSGSLHRQAEGLAVRRHAWLQLSGRLDG